MVEDHKKSESERESVKKMIDKVMLKRIYDLEMRILALEKLMMRWNSPLEHGSGHQNDGGWFD